MTQGQQVKKGDVLGTFDKQIIVDAGYPVTTMVIVTNTKEFADVALDESYGTEVVPGNAILTAVPKVVNENVNMAKA